MSNIVAFPHTVRPPSPAAPSLGAVMYVRQTGRLFYLSPLRGDVEHGASDDIAMLVRAPTLLGSDCRDNTERTWRAWLIGWLDQRGLQAVFL